MMLLRIVLGEANKISGLMNCHYAPKKKRVLLEKVKEGRRRREGKRALYYREANTGKSSGCRNVCSAHTYSICIPGTRVSNIE